MQFSNHKTWRYLIFHCLASFNYFVRVKNSYKELQELYGTVKYSDMDRWQAGSATPILGPYRNVNSLEMGVTFLHTNFRRKISQIPTNYGSNVQWVTSSFSFLIILKNKSIWLCAILGLFSVRRYRTFTKYIYS